MAKISVIIPVYNVKAYLEKCVESVVNQDFSDYEIILIDDGSSDGSENLCDRLGEKYPEIKVIHQENKGQGGARNTGIENASGEYLLFVDSDDYIKEDALSFLYKTATENGSDIVSFGMNFVGEDGKVSSTLKPSENGTRNLTEKEKIHYLITDTYAADKLYRRSLFTENGIKFPERVWYEDFCVVMKAALFAKTLTLTDKILYEYLQRESSTMHVKNTDKNADMLTVVEEILNFYKKNDAFEKYYDELCFMTVMHMEVLCTLRVATEDGRHPLLKKFYDFAKENFPDFKTNKYVSAHLSKRHKIIFAFSKHRMYGMLKLLDKINKLR